MMTSDILTEFAPAKINLTLHVLAQRNDGYHLLESLVVFTEFGDHIHGYLANENRLMIKGRFGSELIRINEAENLIVKTRKVLANYACQNGISTRPVHLICEKNLPIASGLGGGSADAAAVLRLLIKLWKINIPFTDLSQLALKLGADIPMCLQSRPLIMGGIGEKLSLITRFPICHMIIVNPMVMISTADVFKMLTDKNNTSITCPLNIPTTKDLIKIIKKSRNDLETPATFISQKISTCLDLLSTTDPLMVRMSGSGASCFALYDNKESAETGLIKIKRQQPEWFAIKTHVKGR